MILSVEQYYNCLAPTEQGACIYALDSIVPPFIFVIPKDAMDSYFAGAADNFDGRQENWQCMFGFGITTIEIAPGVEREVYTDPYGITDNWRFYVLIHGHWPDLSCRVNSYSDE